MPLFATDELESTFDLDLDGLLALPDLTLEELDLGPSFIEEAFGTRPPQRRPVVHIPGWDEIVHIVPESFLPEEEQTARRRERALRISRSPTPEIVRSFGTIMTFIDDVQDAILTAAVVTRLGAVFFPPLIPIATGLGATAAAIDIYGLWRRLAVAPLTGKFRTNSLTRRVLGAQIVRGLRNPVLQRAIPTVGEAIQILQTTDQLFGIGVSLGPIVGFAQDVIFGLPQGAAFTFQSGIRYKPNDELFLRKEDQDRAEALDLHRTIGAIVGPAGSAAWVLALPDAVSFSDRADSLVLLSLVAELARGFLPESRWEPLVTPSLDRQRPSTRQIRPKTALEIHRLGVDPHATETFPTQGNPATLSTRAQVATVGPQASKNVAAWLAEAPSRPARLLAEQLATDLGFRMARAFDGPGAAFEEHAAPIWRAVIDSLELGLIPPASAEDVAISSYLSAAAILYEGDPGRPIPQRELEQLHVATFASTRT